MIGSVKALSLVLALLAFGLPAQAPASEPVEPGKPASIGYTVTLRATQITKTRDGWGEKWTLKHVLKAECALEAGAVMPFVPKGWPEGRTAAAAPSSAPVAIPPPDDTDDAESADEDEDDDASDDAMMKNIQACGDDPDCLRRIVARMQQRPDVKRATRAAPQKAPALLRQQPQFGAMRYQLWVPSQRQTPICRGTLEVDDLREYTSIGIEGAGAKGDYGPKRVKGSKPVDPPGPEILADHGDESYRLRLSLLTGSIRLPMPGTDPPAEMKVDLLSAPGRAPPRQAAERKLDSGHQPLAGTTSGATSARFDSTDGYGGTVEMRWTLVR